MIQGLGCEARAAGATDDVKTLNELEARCYQIYMEINLGTRQQQLKILALLETELSQEFPKVKPFTLADLCLAGRTPEGRLRSCFKKVLTNEETNERYQLLGAVSRDSASADYTIKITTAPSR